MADKIREITEKIYNEGVVKANKEADSIIADAKEEAKKIIHAAQEQKKSILEHTNMEAGELMKKTQAEIELAAQRLINNLKQHISDKLISIQVGASVKEVFDDNRFIEEMILLIVKNWLKDRKEETKLDLILSPGEEKRLADFFESKLMSELNKGLEIKVDDGVNSGFKIGPKDGNYIISFTENDFENYFRNYLKEKTWELIFGQGD